CRRGGARAACPRCSQARGGAAVRRRGTEGRHRPSCRPHLVLTGAGPSAAAPARRAPPDAVRRGRRRRPAPPLSTTTPLPLPVRRNRHRIGTAPTDELTVP